MKLPDLLPCPFCGWVIPQDDGNQMLDVLYPSGTWWREVDKIRTYHSHKNHADTDHQCWALNCQEIMGGCGASITADTVAELVRKWNVRVGQLRKIVI